MSRLSACYFCGTALEEPLTDVSLDPDADDPPVVTLCPGCREKLETVIDALPADGSVRTSQAEPATGDASAPAGASTESSAAGTGDSGRDPPVGPDGARESDATAAPADAEATDADPGESADEDETERSIVEGDQQISALEYNKVMRLLQNREFPVDREEIVTVAANAYEVSRRDCDRVIDAAIERGLLSEDDAGRLVRAE